MIGVREECRVREQDFGNFQEEQRMKAIKETREKFGRFFYRFPEGESASDVYDRVSSKISLSHSLMFSLLLFSLGCGHCFSFSKYCWGCSSFFIISVCFLVIVVLVILYLPFSESRN